MNRFMLSIGLLFLAAPAALAVDMNEAARMCDANPACAYGARDAGGNLWLVVSGGPKGTVFVSCPPMGDCLEIRRSARYRQDGVAEVERIFSAPTQPGASLPVTLHQTGR